MKGNHYRTIFIGSLCLVLMLVSTFSRTSTTYAYSPSPFIGAWYATDWDGSDFRLVIGGSYSGPFKITITDDYISFCDGGPGIIRGNGWLNQEDPDLLEADLRLECFISGDILDYHYTWRYHPTTDMLSSGWQDGYLIIWHKYGQPVPPPPELDLRVNYNNPNGWVDGFYESGHTVWITITGSDGVSVKATAELNTGEGYYNLALRDWTPTPPVIQPNDWVYGWVDNGASTKVQIGEISGMIDLDDDSISGTINAIRLSDPVKIECFPWGAPQPQPEMKFDTILPDGIETFSCSWQGEWDIQYNQDVGVGYIDPAGNWVANVFLLRNPHLIIYPEKEWFDGWDWPDGALVTITVDGKEDPCTAYGESWGYFFNGGFPEGCDVVIGDTVRMTDGITARVHTVQNLSVTGWDVAEDTVSGIADEGAKVVAWSFGYSEVETTAGAGDIWTVDFTEIVDLQEDMGGVAIIYSDTGNATAVEWHIPSLP